MLYVIWAVLILPVVAVGMILHFKLKEWGKKEWNILPKCLSTWMVVCTAVLGIWGKGDGQGLEKKWILLALFLFLLADGFLELKFYWGMAVFAAGHIVLIGWFISRGSFSFWSLPLWLALLAGALWIFRKELKEGRQNPWLYAMSLYPAVLMGMVSIALLLPVRLGERYLWAAAGALLFGISDMMVGKSFFHKLSKPVSYLALTLYYGGIFCLSMMTWL